MSHLTLRYARLMAYSPGTEKKRRSATVLSSKRRGNAAPLGEGLNKKTRIILAALKKLYPAAGIELSFSNPLELLIATILSAQCTDVRVNQVTAVLFREFRKIDDYVNRPIEELEKIIHSAGFFRQKAKSIRGAVSRIIEEHDGEVPQTMDELVQLPGVGRKTANVILGNAFQIPGLPVDTHVIRLSNRLGLTAHHDPEKIEEELCRIVPEDEWTLFSHLLIWHGRRICSARKPNCVSCPIKSVCNYFAENSAKEKIPLKSEKK